LSDCDTTVCVGCLVEVQEGPLRVSEDPHNFGIVSALTIVSGCLYADIVTNTGHHRLITPDRLCVLSPPGKYSSDQDTCDC
jgi:glycine/serine hydroxymethyltransferase